jgi:chromosome segregation ATPase
MEDSLAATESNLKTCYAQIRALEQDIHTIQKEQKREQAEYKTKVSHMHVLNEKLKQEALDAMAIRKKQQEQISQLQKALGESRAREEGLRRDMNKQSQIIEQRNAEIKDTNNKIGSVSVLAQTLKEKNSTLIRSMASVQHYLNESMEKHSASVQREAALQEQIVLLKAQAEENTKNQGQAVHDAHAKLEQAEDRLAGLESYAEDLKEQVVVISEERDSIMDRLAEKDAENNALSEDKKRLEQKLEEKTIAFAADLERAKGLLGREESLKAELEKQKAVFDARLTEIRTILGISAIAEIKKEITTVGKMYADHQQRIRMCPSVKSPTLRVPLMLGMQHQKAN